MNQVLFEHSLPSGKYLQLVQGDLTKETVDAIVNAANGQLQHGAGVAGAISRGGGPGIQAESNAWVREHGAVSHAKPAYTTGGELPCRYVIHAVGPVWGEGDEEAKLAAAIGGSLRLADQLGVTSIALPAISTGIFGFPRDLAATLILTTLRGYFSDKTKSNVSLVRLVLYDQPTLDAFIRAWKSMGLGDNRERDKG